MNQSSDEDRLIADAVAWIYEQSKQNPDAPYEPDRFMAHLTAPPVKKGRRVSDTFGGRRRFARFMDAVQLELGVCFTQEEWDRGYALEDFHALLRTKVAKPQVNLRLAQESLRRSRSALVEEPAKFGLLALPLLLGAFAPWGTVARLICGALWLIVVGGVALVDWRGYTYGRRLVDRIDRHLVGKSSARSEAV